MEMDMLDIAMIKRLRNMDTPMNTWSMLVSYHPAFPGYRPGLQTETNRKREKDNKPRSDDQELQGAWGRSAKPLRGLPICIGLPSQLKTGGL